MVREKMKHNDGKFFLTITERYGVQYYRESGIFDVGTPNEEPYLYWTRYRDNAHGFKTIKAAKAMARKLMKQYGRSTAIVNRNGTTIESIDK